MENNQLITLNGTWKLANKYLMKIDEKINQISLRKTRLIMWQGLPTFNVKLPKTCNTTFLLVFCEMAAVSDCFSLGSIVWCRTCYNNEVEGEVQAFDPQTKILILSILLLKCLNKRNNHIYWLVFVVLKCCYQLRLCLLTQ